MKFLSKMRDLPSLIGAAGKLLRLNDAGNAFAWSSLVESDDGSVSIGTTTPTTIGSDGLITRPIPSANVDLVQVCPNGNVVDSAGNVGYGTSNAEYFIDNHNYRIRQNGTIAKIKVRATVAAAWTGAYIKIWRGPQSAATLVGKSENFRASLSSGVNTITLASPITGVQEGDFYSIYIEMSGSAGNILTEAGPYAGYKYYYYSDASEAGTGFDWTSATLRDTYLLPIELYMQAPQIVFIGDSITAGHPGHYSFVELTDTTDQDGNYPYWCATTLGATWQNLGVGSETSTEGLVRFTASVGVNNSKPKIAVIEYGINDLWAKGISSTTFINNIRKMMNHCRTNNIIPVIIKMPPGTNASRSASTTGNGAADGTTIVDSNLSDSDATYYNNWWLTVGSETRQVTTYNGTTTLTVSPAFSAQVMSGTAYFLTAQTERDSRMELLSDLVRSYPRAQLIDLDYLLGLNVSAGIAGNLWAHKTAYNPGDGVHFTPAAYRLIGEYIAAEMVRVGSW